MPKVSCLYVFGQQVPLIFHFSQLSGMFLAEKQHTCLQKLFLSSKNSCKEYFDEQKQIKSTTAMYSKLHMFGGKTCHVCTQLEYVFSSHVHPQMQPTVEVIKTKEDKINDIKGKSKDIVTQKLIEVLNSFSLSSSARQPSLNMRFYRLCDLTGLRCIIAVFLKAR